MINKLDALDGWIDNKFIVWYFVFGMIASGSINIIFFNKSQLGNYIILSFGLIAISISLVRLTITSIVIIRELMIIYKEKKGVN